MRDCSTNNFIQLLFTNYWWFRYVPQRAFETTQPPISPKILQSTNSLISYSSTPTTDSNSTEFPESQNPHRVRRLPTPALSTPSMNTVRTAQIPSVSDKMNAKKLIQSVFATNPLFEFEVSSFVESGRSVIAIV
jgi:hypothetical protein